MLARRPFGSETACLEAAETIWWGLGPDAWKEAFSHHPRIGDREALRKKFAGAGSHWSSGEQKGVEGADEAVIDGLARGNDAYFERFGYVFLICATGKSAAEMLAALERRLGNEPGAELRVAAGELVQIMRLRLAKLGPATQGGAKVAQLSTHVLDTTVGLPARGVAVTLEIADGTGFRRLAEGLTNDDGRIPGILPQGTPLAATTYRLSFATGGYFRDRGVEAFYPSVSIVFEVKDAGRHHHVPLLLNPFGYSTYRGS